MSTSGRTRRMKSRLPPKYCSSVRTLSAAAPAAAYAGTTSSGNASAWIQPFDGDLRLNSAMMPVSDASSACFSDRRFPKLSSCRLVSMICSRMSMIR